MKPRFAYIPVEENTRNQLKERKGILSYNDFFKKILDDHNL